jgi:ADP-ribose pyrophosphatase
MNLHEGKHLRLVQTQGWEYAERVQASGAAIVVAVTPRGGLLLTEQHRIPIRRKVIELPAGLAGDLDAEPQEQMATAARRELLEETGYEAEEMIHLTTGPSSAGLTSELVSLFLARGLRKVGPGGGHGDEQILVHEVPLDQVENWLRQRTAEGLLVDPKVFAALYFARQ